MTFAPDLLSGVAVALTGTGPTADAITLRLGSLEAAVHVPGPEALADEAELAAWAQGLGPWRALVVETSDGFGAGGPERLTATLEFAWRATRAVAAETMIAAGQPARIVFVAPRPTAGPHAPAVRAALENLARTLSVEWARHGLTPVAILPGDATPDAEVAELVAYLVSAAGAYLSGCRIELGAVPVRAA